MAIPFGGLVISSLIACRPSGPATYPVVGKITYQGRPVPMGNITLVPEQGRISSTTIKADGTYQLKTTEGRYRVAIIAHPPLPLDFEETYITPPALVPEKYSRPSDSKLTIDVRPTDDNRADFELVD